MEQFANKNKWKKTVLTLGGMALMCSSNMLFAGNNNGNNNNNGNHNSHHDDTDALYKGNCKDITASGATEFHGNLARSDLNLAMAGNQWVVFNKVLSRFNEFRIVNGSLDANEGLDLDHQATWNRDQLRADRNKYFIELIPPGKERAQIISGCMIVGNEKSTNYLPLNIQVDFDVFTSTNYDEMRRLAAAGFVSEAFPYTKNQLSLMVGATNPSHFADPSHSDRGDDISSATLDLLSSSYVVSEVDHVDEGVHKAINGMYKKMDAFVRAKLKDAGGNPFNTTISTIDVAALDAALSDLATPQANSPADCRFDTCGDAAGPSKFTLAENPECHYWTDADGNGVEDSSEHAAHGPNPTLRMCEFAILNKANTHETRVHHVETPCGVLLQTDGGNPAVQAKCSIYTPADVGPVWVSELQFALNAGDKVDGVTFGNSVNGPKIYSVAFLRTMDKDHRALAADFVNFLRTPSHGAVPPLTGEGVDANAQDEYEAGGFNHMTDTDFSATHEIYDCNGDGVADETEVWASDGATYAVPQTCSP